MSVELYCPGCESPRAASPDTPAAEVVERLTSQGPWQILGDGETFEDAVFTALSARGGLCCGECGAALTVREEELGRLTQEVLACW